MTLNRAGGAERPCSPIVGKTDIRPDKVLELPMRFFGRTLQRTRAALDELQPGQILAVHSNDP